MTTIKTVATHEIVRFVHPRPVTEADELGMAEGKAIDSALSQFNYESSQGRKPTLTSMNRYATSIFEEELKDAQIELSPEERRKGLTRIADVLKSFRQSEIFGLLRPKTRMILINNSVGVYAQPDYWDGATRFYEMKSYRAVPPPPDVALQLRMFQLAFPGFEPWLICFDRHTTPIVVTSTRLPALSEEEIRSDLLQALRIGSEIGKEKVSEFIDSPIVQYSVPV
jgi:hypothetical protein